MYYTFLADAVEIDPADAIAQVRQCAIDLLPYAIACAVILIVFRMINNVVNEEKEMFEEDGDDWDAWQARIAAEDEED